MSDKEFFNNMRKEAKAEIRPTEKVDNAFNAFCNELRSAILNEELNMTFTHYTGNIGTYWAEITIPLYHNMTLTLVLADDFVCCGIHTWLDGLFDEDFEALKAMTLKHIQPLTDADKQRIKELQDEIDTIRNKHIK